MNKKDLAIVFAIIMTALFFGCTNDRKPEKEVLKDTSPRQKHEETWENTEKRKDSLWTIICESNDEIEVERAEEMLYETVGIEAWYMLAEKDYEKYKQRVEGEFQQLVEELPDHKNLFFNEKERWENYHDAIQAMISLEDHGSSGTLNIIGALNQSLDLWSASFHNLLLYKQNQDVSFSHTKFTSRMIDDAYNAYINQEDEDWYNAFSDNEKDGMEEHHNAIELEWQLWNEWMAYRKTVSKSLPKDLRKIYDGCTNLTMRTKLHQLKNQNEGLGLINDDIDRCLLPDGCADKELLEYPGFNVALEMYLDSLEN